MRVRRNKFTQIAQPMATAQSYNDWAIGSLRGSESTTDIFVARGWGWLPSLGVVSACGLLLIALGNMRGQSGMPWAESFFWFGLIAIFAPTVTRLLSPQVSRNERIGLVVVLGMALYGVKILHSPVVFNFPDEFIHAYNVRKTLESHALFNMNPALPATPLYPGLQIVTSALAALSGLSIFGAGIVVVGMGRLVLLLALYLLYEQISRSAQVASVATVLYMANSNFIFYSAQYAYESLALPLSVMVLYIAVRRETERDNNSRIAMTFTVIIAMMCVVVTHHMSSYALVAFLGVVSILYPILGRRAHVGIGGLALIGIIATLGWLAYVATLTIGYLSPVFTDVTQSLIGIILHEESNSRELFRSTSGYVAPLWERVSGIASVLLLLLGLPFGLLEIWRRHRNDPFVVVLAGASLGYFGLLGLRFLPAGWELANRASEFLFVGLALVVALGAMKFGYSRLSGWIGRDLAFWKLPKFRSIRGMALTAAATVIFLGGLIAGWSPSVRLARPYRVAAGRITIEPQGEFAAQWTQSYLGSGRRIAADISNARFLLFYGDQYPLTGNSYGIKSLLFSSTVDRSVQQILSYTEAEYVLVDRRRISWDQMLGFYFDLDTDNKNQDQALFDSDVYTKFDREKRVSRLFDSGTIVIYDVRVLSGYKTPK